MMSSDYFIRSDQNVWWNRYADLLRRLQIDHHLKFRWLLDGQVGGLGALKDLVNEVGSASKRITTAGGIRNQATVVYKGIPPAHGRKPVLRGKLGD
jgi:hypothetical protein